MRSMAKDFSHWFQAFISYGRLACQHQRRGSIGDRAGVGCGDCAVCLKRRFQLRDFVDIGVPRLLISIDDGLTFAVFDRNRCDLSGERSGFDCCHGASQ